MDAGIRITISPRWTLRICRSNSDTPSLLLTTTVWDRFILIHRVGEDPIRSFILNLDVSLRPRARIVLSVDTKYYFQAFARSGAWRNLKPLGGPYVCEQCRACPACCWPRCAQKRCGPKTESLLWAHLFRVHTQAGHGFHRRRLNAAPQPDGPTLLLSSGVNLRRRTHKQFIASPHVGHRGDSELLAIHVLLLFPSPSGPRPVR